MPLCVPRVSPLSPRVPFPHFPPSSIPRTRTARTTHPRAPSHRVLLALFISKQGQQAHRHKGEPARASFIPGAIPKHNHKPTTNNRCIDQNPKLATPRVSPPLKPPKPPHLKLKLQNGEPKIKTTYRMHSLLTAERMTLDGTAITPRMIPPVIRT